MGKNIPDRLLYGFFRHRNLFHPRLIAVDAPCITGKRGQNRIAAAFLLPFRQICKCKDITVICPFLFLLWNHKGSTDQIIISVIFLCGLRNRTLDALPGQRMKNIGSSFMTQRHSIDGWCIDHLFLHISWKNQLFNQRISVPYRFHYSFLTAASSVS